MSQYIDGEYTYAGIHPDCGGWRALTVDCEVTKPDLAKDMRSWLKYGLTVERVLTENIRNSTVKMCECKQKKKSRQGDLFDT